MVQRNLLLSSPRQFMYLKNLWDIIVFKKWENINIAYFFMTEAVKVSEELAWWWRQQAPQNVSTVYYSMWHYIQKTAIFNWRTTSLRVVFHVQKAAAFFSLWDKQWTFFSCQLIWTLKSNCLSDMTQNASEVLTARVMEKPSTAHLKKSTGYLFLGHWTIKLLWWREKIECFGHVTH
jgi:hypothetical protein